MMIFIVHVILKEPKTDPVNTNAQFNDKIEAVQYNAALAITGCVRGTSREKLYSELGLTSLYDR